MFSERLENLIKASLQDGILTDQEKQAILKRAEAEGEDPNEVDIYIQSLIQKSQQSRRQKEDEKDEQIAKEKKKAMGRVCPQCGRQIPALTLKCECGFEFPTASSKQKSAVQDLVDKIDKINSGRAEDKQQRILNAISLFPVPNTKEDILDFLALSAPNSKKKRVIWTWTAKFVVLVIASIILGIIILFLGQYVAKSDPENGFGYAAIIVPAVIIFLGLFLVQRNDDEIWNEKAVIWRAKFDEVLLKGRSLRGDPEFQRQLDYYENMINKK